MGSKNSKPLDIYVYTSGCFFLSPKVCDIFQALGETHLRLHKVRAISKEPISGQTDFGALGFMTVEFACFECSGRSPW